MPQRCAVTLGFDISRHPLPDQIQALRNLVGYYTAVWQEANEYYKTKDDPVIAQWFSLQKTLEVGRDYLVGSTWSMPAFVRRHRSRSTSWQQTACQICWQHPEISIRVEIPFPALGYVICWRGEYVQIGLPYQTRGGEKHWVCAPPFKTKILVNVD